MDSRGALSIAALLVSTPLCFVTMRFSRVGREEEDLYSPASLNLCTELLKLAVSLAMVARTAAFSSNNSSAPSAIRSPRNWALCSLPAVLYFGQNLMSVYALSVFPSSLFIAVLNTKILFAALFSKLLLSASFTLDAVLYLVLIVAGVGVVASTCESSHGIVPASPADAASAAAAFQLGIILALCSALTSGLAGAYSQLFLQRTFATVWEANVVMGATSALLATAVCAWQNANAAESDGFGGFGHLAGGFGGFGGWFSHWTLATVAVAMAEAGHGILSALAVKYTNSVIKAVVGAATIVVTSAVDTMVFGDVVSLPTFLGEMVVGAAAIGYIRQQAKASALQQQQAPALPMSSKDKGAVGDKEAASNATAAAGQNSSETARGSGRSARWNSTSVMAGLGAAAVLFLLGFGAAESMRQMGRWASEDPVLSRTAGRRRIANKRPLGQSSAPLQELPSQLESWQLELQKQQAIPFNGGLLRRPHKIHRYRL